MGLLKSSKFWIAAAAALFDLAAAFWPDLPGYVPRGTLIAAVTGLAGALLGARAYVDGQVTPVAIAARAAERPPVASSEK